MPPNSSVIPQPHPSVVARNAVPPPIDPYENITILPKERGEPPPTSPGGPDG